MTSVGVLHERFPFIGGAEQVAIEAARVLDAPIYTSYVSPGVQLPDDVRIVPCYQSKYTEGISGRLLSRRGAITEQSRMINLASDISSMTGEIENHDIIFASGSISKHYLPETGQKIVSYPHTTPRYYYDLHRDAMESFQIPVIGTGIELFSKVWRSIDKESNDYVDLFVANSEVVQDRIRTYYNRDAELLHPPVTGDWRNEGDEGYFVTWSRLDPNKRIDLIIRAFSQLDEQLIIAGDGPERERLEELAEGHDNITLKGFVDDIESLVARATAVVYAPHNEDFGLVGAEALKAGKPLLGVDEGYTSYQIKPKTGEFFSPDIESIVSTIESFNPNDYDESVITQVGQRYSHSAFSRSLLEIVHNVDNGSYNR